MRNHVLLYILLVLFAGLAVGMAYQIDAMIGHYTTMAQELGEGFSVRDNRIFSLNNRIQTLEEERGLELRITNLEKAIRTYCLENKVEMCGSLDTVNR